MLSIRSLSTTKLVVRSCSYYYSSSTASAAAVEAERTIREGPRNVWTRQQIDSIYHSPLLDLLFHGAQVHRYAHNFREVQQCTLLSIKTGGCSEDCSYCPQSSRYHTGLKPHKLMTKDAVMQAAKQAKEAGSTRFCMGAAWRDTVGRKTNFNQILEYPVEIWEMIRMIATARIVMPKSMVRLSAGRVRFSMPEQALCFLAGANSIFTGEKLLTTPNNDYDADQVMFKILGLIPKAPSFTEEEAENCDEAVSTSG
ncbi:hypothetical protein GOBAR_DD13372 [Gossypium barbadense]|nr:hypothetical protein GOBAR_DD13372 [Gossypium barbadense]